MRSRVCSISYQTMYLVPRPTMSMELIQAALERAETRSVYASEGGEHPLAAFKVASAPGEAVPKEPVCAPKKWPLIKTFEIQPIDMWRLDSTRKTCYAPIRMLDQSLVWMEFEIGTPSIMMALYTAYIAARVARYCNAQTKRISFYLYAKHVCDHVERRAKLYERSSSNWG